jgi:glutaredoxin
MHITLFWLPGCPYSEKAHLLLKSYKNVEFIKLDDSNIKIFKKKIFEKFNYTKIPVLLFNINDIEYFLGGCSELELLLEHKNKLMMNCDSKKKKFSELIQLISKKLKLDKKIICKFYTKLFS